MAKSTSNVAQSIIYDYQTIVKMHRNMISMVNGMLKAKSNDSFRQNNNNPLPLEAIDSIIDSMQILLLKQRKFNRKINLYFFLNKKKISINNRMLLLTNVYNRSHSIVNQHHEVFCQLLNANLSLIISLLKERSNNGKSTVYKVGQEIEYLTFILARMVEGLFEAVIIWEHTRIPTMIDNRKIISFLKIHGINLTSYQTINGKVTQILALLERIHKQRNNEYLRERILTFRQFLQLIVDGKSVNNPKRKEFENYNAPAPWFSNQILSQYCMEKR